MSHEQKAYGARVVGYTLAQQHGLPLTKVDLGLTLKLLYSNIPQEGQPSTCGRLITLDHFIMEKAVLCSQ